jgi:hypothetical protein
MRSAPGSHGDAGSWSDGDVSVPSALFERDGATLLPTTLCRGPWDPAFLHGGPVCGALGWALEQTPAVARITGVTLSGNSVGT